MAQTALALESNDKVKNLQLVLSHAAFAGTKKFAILHCADDGFLATLHFLGVADGWRESV